ncbi:MAG: ABC transporter permease subunit [Wenzhouxiangellaceae bacterium]
MIQRLRPDFRRWVITIPWLWLAGLLLAPLLVLLALSLSQAVLAMPPYLPLWQTQPDGGVVWNISLESYQRLLADDLYWRAWLHSLKLAAGACALTLACAYPMAYSIARAPRRWQSSLLLLILLPFWTSFLIRVYAWVGILKSNGLLNQLLLSSGLIEQPLQWLYTDFAVYLGITYSYLPLMVLPIYASLQRIDDDLLAAAADLGASAAQVFWRVTWPLSRAGVIAGCVMVFIPSVGEFVIPDLLGDSATPMIGQVVWAEFFHNRDWPMAAALALSLLLLLVAPALGLRRLWEQHS